MKKEFIEQTWWTILVENVLKRNTIWVILLYWFILLSMEKVNVSDTASSWQIVKFFRKT